MQKAILTFTDGDNGEIHVSLEFEPEISETTISGAATSAIACMEYITDVLASRG